MSNLLNKFTVPVVRRRVGDVDIYNVKTEEQIQILQNLINQSKIETTEDGVEKGSVTVGFDTIRTLIREFTSIYTEIDEIDDKTLENGLNTLDSEISIIVNELKSLYRGYASSYMKRMSDALDDLLLQLEAQEVKQKSYKILTGAGINITWEEFNNLTEEKINEMMNGAKEKQVKKPQDYKKSVKKTGSKKKVKEESKANTINKEKPLEETLGVTQEQIEALNRLNNKVNDEAVKYNNDIATIGEIASESKVEE